jgi:hypothetical protein
MGQRLDEMVFASDKEEHETFAPIPDNSQCTLYAVNDGEVAGYETDPQVQDIYSLRDSLRWRRVSS